MSALAQALSTFMAAYHGRPDLVAEQRGWSRTIAVVAADTGEALAIDVQDGRIVDVRSARSGDVVITSDAATLCDVLSLRRGPNEPYLFGELTVEGAQGDSLRLDYIAGMLCPR